MVGAASVPAAAPRTVRRRTSPFVDILFPRHMQFLSTGTKPSATTLCPTRPIRVDPLHAGTKSLMTAPVQQVRDGKVIGKFSVDMNLNGGHAGLNQHTSKYREEKDGSTIDPSRRCWRNPWPQCNLGTCRGRSQGFLEPLRVGTAAG